MKCREFKKNLRNKSIYENMIIDYFHLWIKILVNAQIFRRKKSAGRSLDNRKALAGRGRNS
jgi:hypothetical protein